MPFDKNSRNCSRNSREKDKQQSEEKNKIMNFDNSDWTRRRAFGFSLVMGEEREWYSYRLKSFHKNLREWLRKSPPNVFFFASWPLFLIFWSSLCKPTQAKVVEIINNYPTLAFRKTWICWNFSLVFPCLSLYFLMNFPWGKKSLWTD